jgi:outer membrane immunogenic protein
MRIAGLIVAASVAATAIVGAASAADLPARPYTKAPVMVDPAYNWTGFYAGANAGYGWGDPAVSYSPNDVLAAIVIDPGVGGTPIPSARHNSSGALGGGQIGYNWQIDRSWLWGLEADIDGSNIRGTAVSNFLLAGPPSNMTSVQTVDWFGTVRARLGWLPTDRLLLFATGGFAYGSVRENVALNSATGFSGSNGGFGYFCGTVACFTGSSSGIATGYTAGAGLEYAFSRSFSLKAEYLYVSLGGRNVSVVALTGGQPAPSSFNTHYGDQNFNVVRVGANYHF